MQSNDNCSPSGFIYEKVSHIKAISEKWAKGSESEMRRVAHLCGLLEKAAATTSCEERIGLTLDARMFFQRNIALEAIRIRIDSLVEGCFQSALDDCRYAGVAVSITPQGAVFPEPKSGCRKH